MRARVIIDEDSEPLDVATAAELDSVLSLASEEARTRGRLNVISIEAANGNALSIVVGGHAGRRGQVNAGWGLTRAIPTGRF
jgi:hypothetical protein